MTEKSNMYAEVKMVEFASILIGNGIPVTCRALKGIRIQAPTLTSSENVHPYGSLIPSDG